LAKGRRKETVTNRTLAQKKTTGGEKMTEPPSRAAGKNTVPVTRRQRAVVAKLKTGFDPKR